MFFLPSILFTYLLCFTYFFLKFSNKKYENTTIFVSLVIFFLFFSLSISTVNLSVCSDFFTSLNFYNFFWLKVYTIIYFFMFLFYYMLLGKTKSGHYANSLPFAACLFFYFYFFLFFFIFNNHFELICLLEYLNTITLLYILLTTPKLGFTKFISSRNLSLNFRYSSFYYFLPSTLNYFFLVFFVSIIVFFLYVYLLLSLNFVIGFDFIVFFRDYRLLVLFFLFFLILKLGAAPLHFWKLEIFESYRLPQLVFYSTIYVFVFFFIFELVIFRMGLLSSGYGHSCFSFFIILNLFFIVFNINTILTLRQLFVLSSLLNMNLALLSLVFSFRHHSCFFFLFNLLYIFSIFIFYSFFILFSANNRFTSKISTSRNKFQFFFFFYVPFFL